MKKEVFGKLQATFTARIMKQKNGNFGGGNFILAGGSNPHMIN